MAGLGIRKNFSLEYDTIIFHIKGFKKISPTKVKKTAPK